MKFATKAIHAGTHPDSATGAIMTPIYQTSTYVQEAPGKHKGFEYSRSQNPTRSQLEANLAALENGRFGFCFGSGMAAIDALFRILKPGDHVVSTGDLYGGSYRLFTQIFEPIGVEFSFVNMANADLVELSVQSNTRLIWVETPTNPMMNIIDIEAISKVAKKHECRLAVDNTFASPYLQNPLDLGADVVMHSITKFIAGHSDVVMGCLITSDEQLAGQLYFIQKSCGAIPGPQDCFLTLRGIKTLHLRMQRHCENGMAVAQFLKDHPKVDAVYYPGLEDHPNHEIAVKQMRGFGGMVSFNLKGNDLSAAQKVISNTQIFSLAESLGGVESLCGHPATMTHASIPKEEREKLGIVDSLIRLSVGVEDITDILLDLEQALDKK